MFFKICKLLFYGDKDLNNISYYTPCFTIKGVFSDC